MGGGGDYNKKKGGRKKYAADSKMKETVDNKNEVRTAAPLFVPATRDGVLASRLRLEEEKLGKLVGWRYKIVERGGNMLRDLLTRSNIFEKEKCGRLGCVSCSMGAKPQNCRRRGIMYETFCTECMDG